MDKPQMDEERYCITEEGLSALKEYERKRTARQDWIIRVLVSGVTTVLTMAVLSWLTGK